MLTAEQLREIRERAERATPGPWYTSPTGMTYEGFSLDVVIAATAPGRLNRVYASPPGGKFPAADQEFIAHAREDVPALLQHIDELVELLREARPYVGYHSLSLTDRIDAALSIHDAEQEQRADEPQPETTDKLPPGRRRVYEAIARLEARLGYGPSTREIAMEAGLTSTAVVHQHLMRLQEAGLIRRATNKQGYVIERGRTA